MNKNQVHPMFFPWFNGTKKFAFWYPLYISMFNFVSIFQIFFDTETNRDGNQP